MRTIEITTSQNVTIEYELAALQDRIIAFFIDMFFIWFSNLILTFIYFILFNDQGYPYFAYFVLIPIATFYTLVLEIAFDGQTFGKKLLHIRVVKLNGKEASLSDYFIRWVFRLIDIGLSFGGVACILISSSDKNQRLGDILANTALIRLKPKRNLRLDDILNISTLESYTPAYPNVRRLQEEEMLFIKSVAERVRRFPNRAHMEALNELTEKLKKRLEIDTLPGDKLNFLRTLIRDYIVLTR